jgi:L-lactate dehydrogenase complex protein LldG
MERDAFLARVRTAGSAAELPATPGADGPLVWSPEPGDLVDRFIANLTAVAGVADRVDRDRTADHIVDLLQSYNADRCLAWADDELPVAGIHAALGAADIEVVDDVVPEDPSLRLSRQKGFDNVSAGVTGSLAGLAESGSIVLSAGRGRGRMASLLPPVHIAILEVDTIHASLSHFAAAHPDAARITTNLIFVTGPSRTGDIETHINLGVHGPRHLHVVMID